MARRVTYGRPQTMSVGRRSAPHPAPASRLRPVQGQVHLVAAVGVCAEFGVSKDDLLQFFERVSDERGWPLLSVPLTQPRCCSRSRRGDRARKLRKAAQ